MLTMTERGKRKGYVIHLSACQGWAIPGFGQQYYTLYYTGQKMQNYTILYTNNIPSQVNQF